MRKQEFNSKLISLLPLDEVPVHVPLRRPRPLRFERLRVSVESIQPRPPRPCEVGRPKGRRRKNRRQSHTFFLSTCCAVPMIEAMIEAMIDVEIDAVIDPLPPFPFCCPQAIVDEEAGVSIPNSSPFSRSTRFPFTSTASPPAPLAIRKAPSASVESIQPRPPQPCEVGRPKGRRRKSRRQSHNFF